MPRQNRLCCLTPRHHIMAMQDDLAAEGKVNVSGLCGPMALWFIAPTEQHGECMAPSEAP